MSKHESAVREAAICLHDSIKEAEKAGLVVTWPHRASGLPAIAISETRSAAERPLARKPQSKKPAATTVEKA